MLFLSDTEYSPGSAARLIDRNLTDVSLWAESRSHHGGIRDIVWDGLLNLMAGLRTDHVNLHTTFAERSSKSFVVSGSAMALTFRPLYRVYRKIGAVRSKDGEDDRRTLC